MNRARAGATSPPRRRLSAVPFALLNERGSLLIEVMAGAMLVALIAMAVLAGFDGAFATSGKNKARSVAATLAEQDIERMRSYTSVELSGYSETQTKTVAN